MLIAQFSEVSKSFGSQDVLDNIHWQIQDRSRLALVGRNGAGKTTLFRLLTGELELDRGNIWRQKGAVIAAMEQEVRVDDRRTLREEAAEGLEHVKQLHREFEEVTHRMGELREGDPESEEILDRYAHLQDRLEREGGYTFESQVRSVLGGLHFTEDDLDRPLSEFSGGQKSRAALARVLLRDPDLLLLDEPTNHLDLVAIEWLENFLINYQGAFVLVSHDRMFVNRLAKGVVELRQRKLHQFVGNYDEFLAARTQRLEEQAKHYELQRAEIKRQEEFIRKNIAGQKTKQAQSRRKMLGKLKRIEEPEWPASSIRMRLPEAERSARIVVDAKDLAKSYGKIKVFRDVSFQLLRGQKLGLIGPNGVGKTTLARLLIGEESQDSGTLRIGPGVQIGYSEQEQASLTGSQSVLDEVWAVTPPATEGEIRGFLGGFLFRGDDVFKPMSALSGGERSRVALAKLVREGANLLVLDEPTNHLDVESREVIESALRSFTGTVLAVSHDRYFLDRVVDHVLELRSDGCRLWEGGYSQFARARTEQAVAKRTGPAQQVKPQPASAAKAAPKVERVQNYEENKRRKREEERLRKRIQRAESRIDRLEEERHRILMEMAEPELATQAEELGKMDRTLQETEKKIQEAISEWERLSMRLEAFLDGPN